MAENITASKKYDIVFIIDESGSMQEYINKVRDNISSFVQSLNADGVDVQLGLVEYGDGSLSIKKHELTSNVDTFISQLGAISAYGARENGLTAIMDGKNGAISMNFREGANKEFIVVTDEGYMENDSGYSYYRGTTPYSQDDVTRKLNEIGAKLDVFGAMKESYTSTRKAYNDYFNAQYGEGWCQDEWTPIAEKTSGILINGNSDTGHFFDITSDFFGLMRRTINGNDNGTHQLAFAQWSYGFTPSTGDNVSATSSVVPGA